MLRNTSAPEKTDGLRWTITSETPATWGDDVRLYDEESVIRITPNVNSGSFVSFAFVCTPRDARAFAESILAHFPSDESAFEPAQFEVFG